MNKRERSVYFTYVKLEALRFLREPISLFFTLIFPLLLIYIFGDSFGAKTSGATGKTFYNSLVSIDIAFLIANFTLMGIGNDLANQKELGITESMSLLPIKKWEKTLIESTAYLIILFISTVLITGYVYLAFKGIAFQGNIVLYLLLMILSYFVFVSITKFIVSFDLSARTIQLISSTVFFIMLFASGIVIPKESLPKLLRGFINYSPLYNIYYLLDSVWNNVIKANDLLMRSGYFVLLIIVFSLFSKRRKLINN